MTAWTRRPIAAIVLAVIETSCFPEYKFGTVEDDDGGDADTGAVGDPDGEGDCDFADRIPYCFKVDTLETLSLDGGPCIIYADSPGEFTEEITGFVVLGDDSLFPESSPLRVAIETNEDDPTDSYPREDFTPISAPVTAEDLGDGCWMAESDGASDLGTLNGCVGDSVDGTCTYDWMMLVIDDPPEPACEFYTLGDTYVCLEGHSPLEIWPRVDIDTSGSGGARCEPGGGRFLLLPTSTVNIDGDTKATTLYRPVQTSGTGVLTADARINRVEPLRYWDGRLKMLRGDRDRTRIGFDDHLIPVNDSVVILDLQPGSFLDADIAATSCFVLEEEPIGSSLPVFVDLQWACPSPSLESILNSDTVGTTEQPTSPSHDVALPSPSVADMLAPGIVSTDRPVSYRISIADLDCIGSWPQALSIGVIDRQGRRSLAVEPYGFPDLRREVALHGSVGAEKFSGATRGLSYSGILKEANSVDDQTTLVVDYIGYRGVPVCTPGEHRLVKDRLPEP